MFKVSGERKNVKNILLNKALKDAIEIRMISYLLILIVLSIYSVQQVFINDFDTG